VGPVSWLATYCTHSLRLPAPMAVALLQASNVAYSCGAAADSHRASRHPTQRIVISSLIQVRLRGEVHSNKLVRTGWPAGVRCRPRRRHVSLPNSGIDQMIPFVRLGVARPGDAYLHGWVRVDWKA
jgi:hypothetical protein